MELRHNKYDITFEIKENYVNVFVVEHTVLFREIIQSLQEQCCGGEGDFILSDGNKILDMSKNIDFVLDLFALDCNDRSIITKLYQNLTAESRERCLVKQQEFFSKYTDYLSELALFSELPVSLNRELDLPAFLKFAGVKPEIQYDTLPEKIIEYVEIRSKLLKQNIFIFLNLKMYLTSEEISSLYKECFYRKVYLVLLEPFLKNRQEGEKIYILDNDKCLIYY